MIVLEIILLLFLVFCAVAAVMTKRLMASVIIFMSYSSVMAILWFLLESPDHGHYRGRCGGRVSQVCCSSWP